MANYTEQEIEAFLDFEIESAHADEMYSEQMAEAQMNAHSFGMDGIAMADMPRRWVPEIPEGYEAWNNYYGAHFSETSEEFWSRTDEENLAIHHNWRLITVGIGVRLDRDVAEKWWEEKQARAAQKIVDRLDWQDDKTFGERVPDHDDFPF